MVENIIRINRAEFDRLALLTEKKGYALVEFTQPDDQDITPLVLIPDEGRVELLTEFDRNNELVEICHATKEEL